MEIVIVKEKMYGHDKEVITIKDDGIYFEEGNSYPRLVSNNVDVIDALFTRFFSITYTWKQEYIGERVFDGERYLIEVDINHKKKKYKIQNKYPENWEEFLSIKENIMEFCKE